MVTVDKADYMDYITTRTIAEKNGMAKQARHVYHLVRYRFGKALENDIHGVELGGQHADGDAWRESICVSAWRGRDSYASDWVEVHVESLEMAEKVFRQLWSVYPCVRVKTRSEETPDYSVERVAASLVPDFLRRPTLCCEPCNIVVGRGVEERQRLFLALAAKQRLPKSVRSVRGAPPSGPINPRLRARILERDGFRCKRCGAGAERASLEVDHITPRSKGGTNLETNLQTLCWSCNRGKGASDPHPTELSA